MYSTSTDLVYSGLYSTTILIRTAPWLHNRVRRLKLLGQVLRMDECRYMRKAILALRKSYPKGSILMDAPRRDTTPQLIAMAEDAEVWQIEVNALKQRLKLTLKNSSKPRT